MAKTNTGLIVGGVVIGLAVIGILFLLIGTAGSGSGSDDSGVTGSATASDTMKITLSDISGTAKFYEYESGGKTIRFFAVKASDGSIKTGFDACDVCHSSGKGYRQEGNNMVCNNCGNKYPIAGLGTQNTNPGGCWPGYLANSIEGDSIVIKKTDIESGAWRF